ncbi:apolipoprotein N-acyltransferase [Corynebacterium pelargi]|uniref:Apolipoprotein N-acyltransferase n=1 Tax=Corynebacterium pelargi TaxID=1471400 RepID=A0A410W8X1_9CORY|nr:Apolipoprotein N-acyltransferase [Corynebacterium pelargi]GGG67939.1 apolipoprotein N-acyltransferase [Corynebacterium pelargi]
MSANNSLSTAPVLNILWRIICSALAGVCIYASYEPLGWWWAALLGIALLIASVYQATWRVGALMGFCHAMVLYVLLLPWIGEFVGIGPYLALCVFLSLFSLVLGAVAPAVLQLRGGFLAFAMVYMLVEFVRSHVPFGGFAWVRLAWGQIDGPVAYLAPLGGPALVSATTAVLGACIWKGVRAVFAQPRRFQMLGGVVAVLLLLSAWPMIRPERADDLDTVTVAAVQGNVPRLGLDFNAQRMAVLENHAKATMGIDQPVDVAIWPENSADVDPFADPRASALIGDAVAEVQAPVVVGAVTRDDVGARNQVVAFDAEGNPGEYHNKKYLQPFGEWMPWRDFFRLFSEKVDLAGDFKPGDGDGVIHVDAALLGKRIAIGIATCYEVAFDAAGRDAVRAGAQLLATPTNNATFGFSDMTYQQLAMSRMRALELDRAVVVPATSGVSAIVQPDGSVVQQSRIFEQAVLIEQVPLRNTLTPAVHIGRGIELGLVMIGAICLCIPWLTRSRNRR